MISAEKAAHPSQWSVSVTRSFTEVPPDKAAAFSASMDYLARIIFKELTAPRAELEAVKANEEEAAELLEINIAKQKVSV